MISVMGDEDAFEKDVQDDRRMPEAIPEVEEVASLTGAPEQQSQHSGRDEADRDDPGPLQKSPCMERGQVDPQELQAERPSR